MGTDETRESQLGLGLPTGHTRSHELKSRVPGDR
jgi:hypothetical protein